MIGMWTLANMIIPEQVSVWVFKKNDMYKIIREIFFHEKPSIFYIIEFHYLQVT